VKLKLNQEEVKQYLIDKGLNKDEIEEIKGLIEMMHEAISLKKLSKRDTIWFKRFVDYYISQK
jgi:lipopolysaccharide biosynthesis glycosyltransferase